MKFNIQLLLLGLFIVSIGVCQAQQKLGQELILFNNSDYRLKSEFLDDNFNFEISNKKDNTKNQNFSIPSSQFEFEIFKEIFQKKLIAAGDGDDNVVKDSKLVYPKNKLDNELSRVFYRIQGIVSVKDNLKEEPLAGRLFFEKEITAKRFFSVFTSQNNRLVRKGMKKDPLLKKNWSYSHAFGLNNSKVKKIEKTGCKRRARKRIVEDLLDFIDQGKKEEMDLLLQKANESVFELLKSINEVNHRKEERDNTKIKLEGTDTRISNLSIELNAILQDSLRNAEVLDSLRILLNETSVTGGFAIPSIKDGITNIILLKERDSLRSDINKLTKETSKLNTDFSGYKLTQSNQLRDEERLLKDTLKKINESKLTIESMNYLKASVIEVSDFRKQIIEQEIKMYNDQLTQLQNFNATLSTAFQGAKIVQLSQGKAIEEKKASIVQLKDSKTSLSTDIDEQQEKLFEKQKLKNDLVQQLNSDLMDLSKKYNSFHEVPLRLDTLEFEFNEGYIENIKLVGVREKVEIIESIPESVEKELDQDILDSFNPKIFKLENQYPIGFTAIKNYWKMKGNNLYQFGKGIDGNPQVKIPVDEVFSYIQKHQVDRRDFSPANQIQNIFPQSSGTNYVDLKKLDRRKLFELRIYSDFVGLDSNEPNGLVQSEIYKKWNLISHRYYKSNGLLRALNYGILQYLRPGAIISKVEGDDRQLVLSNRDNVSFASTLDLKLFQNFQTGFDLNLLLLDIPSAKVTFYLDAGIWYGRTSVSDTTRTLRPGLENNGNFTVNTYEVSPFRFKALFRSDEDFNLKLGYDMNLFYLRNNDFTQVANTTIFEENGNDLDSPKRYRFNTFEMEVTFNPNKNPDNQPIDNTGRWFFRYRYNWQRGLWRTGFHQLQVGYSIPLFKKITG